MINIVFIIYIKIYYWFNILLVLTLKNTSQIEVKNGESGTERFQFVYFKKTNENNSWKV